MDVFIKAEAFEFSAYLTSAGGDVWRVWFGNDNQPLLQRLLPIEIQHLDAVRKREAARGG